MPPALLAANDDPSEDEVRAALDGNLCRCGAQNRIVRAVLAAAASLRASRDGAGRDSASRDSAGRDGD